MLTPSMRVRAALLAQGDTIQSWASRHGHNPELARRVISRYASGDRRRPPFGEKTRAILSDIRRDTGLDLRPIFHPKDGGWVRVAELAGMPGMPAETGSIRRMIRAGRLVSRRRLVGKGYEVQVSSLPEETQTYIAGLPGHEV